MHDQPRKS